MRTALAVLLLLATLGAALAQGATQGFTPAQRREIVAVLRDALMRDPSILRDALAALGADDARQQESAARDRIASLGPHLVDPADPVEGNPAGTATVVEFYDTRCPYCRTMEPVVASLLRADAGVRVVVKDLPILGPNSQLESRALLAAQKQDGYCRLRPAVLALSGTTTRDALRDLAERAGLDGARLLRDMDDPAIAARLAANVALARQLAIDGTPAFVVGTRLISGATDLADLQAAVADARKP